MIRRSQKSPSAAASIRAPTRVDPTSTSIGKSRHFGRKIDSDPRRDNLPGDFIAKKTA